MHTLDLSSGLCSSRSSDWGPFPGSSVLVPSGLRERIHGMIEHHLGRTFPVQGLLFLINLFFCLLPARHVHCRGRPGLSGKRVTFC